MTIQIHTFEGTKPMEACPLKATTPEEKQILTELALASIYLFVHPAWNKTGYFTASEKGSGLACAWGTTKKEAVANAYARIQKAGTKDFIQLVQEETKAIRVQNWMREDGAHIFMKTFGVPLTWCADQWWATLTGRLSLEPAKIEKMLYHQRGNKRRTLPQISEGEEPSIADRVEERFGKFGRHLIELLMKPDLNPNDLPVMSN